MCLMRSKIAIQPLFLLPQRAKLLNLLPQTYELSPIDLGFLFL